MIIACRLLLMSTAYALLRATLTDWCVATFCTCPDVLVHFIEYRNAGLHIQPFSILTSMLKVLKAILTLMQTFIGSAFSPTPKRPAYSGLLGVGEIRWLNIQVP